MKKRRTSSAFVLRPLRNYSSTGALTGHASAQEPQLMHSSALITYLPSPSEMQLTGQASAQAPQLMHSSVILYAILKTSILVFRLYSNIFTEKIKYIFKKKLKIIDYSSTISSSSLSLELFLPGRDMILTSSAL